MAQRDVLKLIDQAAAERRQDADRVHRDEMDILNRRRDDYKDKLVDGACTALEQQGFRTIRRQIHVGEESRPIGKQGYGPDIYVLVRDHPELQEIEKLTKQSERKHERAKAAIKKAAEALRQAVILNSGPLPTKLQKRIEKFIKVDS